MKKQKKENPAQAALANLAVRLSTSNLQPAKPVASPTEEITLTPSEEGHEEVIFLPSEGDLATSEEIDAAASERDPKLEQPNLIITRPSKVLDITGTEFKEQIGNVVQIPIDRLRIEDNVRAQIIEDEDFEALVESIREKGVLQNLVVQITTMQDGREDLIIISGQRRWLACRKAGKATAPCLIIAEEDQRTRIVYGLIENLLREDLTPIDIGVAYSKLIDLGATQDELARTFGCHKKTIQRYLSLTAWPQAAIDILRQHPRLFSTDFLFNGISRDILSDPDLLVLRLGKIVEQAKGGAGNSTASQTLKASKQSDAKVTQWNQTARQNLGVPITISGSKDNLRITIRCVGDASVKKIMEKLGIATD
jgi:ParB family transcriptional regulator, chromosome partitioning protein